MEEGKEERGEVNRKEGGGERRGERGEGEGRWRGKEGREVKEGKTHYLPRIGSHIM